MRARTLLALTLLALTLLATPAAAQTTPTTPGTSPGTVTTHATARDRLPNTVADVTLGIEVHGRTLPEVQSALAAATGQLLAYLRTTPATRTRTQSVAVRPELDPEPARNRPPRIIGYTGTTTISLQVPATGLPGLLGDALAHGANSIDDTSTHPSQSELDGKRQSLAAEATRRAMADARVVAEAAGRQLGMVRAITVTGPDSIAPRSFAMAAPAPMARPSAAAPAPPIATDAGDTELTATVTVTVALIEP